jgi:hypothetical protein
MTDETLQWLIHTTGEQWLRRRRSRWVGGPWLRFAAAVQRRHAQTGARLAIAEEVADRLQALWPGQGQRMTPSFAPSSRPAAASYEAPVPMRLTQHGDEFADVPPPPPSMRWQPSEPGAAPSMDDEQTVRWASVTAEPGQPLDPTTQAQLTGLLRQPIPAVEVHTSGAADELTRQYHADAVTYGEHILLRAGRFAPQTPRGLALLGHEVTHVAQQLADAEPGSFEPSPAEQERVARQNEQAILRQQSGTASTATSAWPALPTAPRPSVLDAPVAAPALQAAEVDRPLGIVNGMPNNGSLELTERQLRQLKETIYRDLRERIRTEFERGA